MEKKRKLPARAAARVEQVSKKRTTTPPDNRSATPAPPPAPAAAAVPEEPSAPPPQPLPKSIQPGKPLPVVDDAQPDDLPNKEYQSIQESGVLGESLQRSRQTWISEGIFEKFWTKPTKRKGVVIEAPNNPPKDSMARLGPVTVIVEPHVFDAVMYAVKDPKPPPPPPSQRPIIQYGPPNGTMPPPSAPASAPSSAPPTPVLAGTPGPAQPPPASPAQQSQTATEPDQQRSTSAAPVQSTKPTIGAEPRTIESGAPPVPPSLQPAEVQQDASRMGNISQANATPPTVPPANPIPAAAQPSFPGRPPPPPSAMPGAAVAVNGTPSVAPAPGDPRSPAAHPAGTDPIIAMLAHKATEDEQLRDLMKRVAQGRAPKDELERFQAIIDQITAETKRQGSVQGPSAHRLVVHGRTVRYFADEVSAILDIVLTTNPRQTSADLRPPAKSDPLVVELVKAALDEPETRDIVRRIAEDRPQFADATDLKLILEKLRQRIAKEEAEKQLKASNNVQAASSSGAPNAAKTNGAGSSGPNGSGTPPMAAAAPQQALRSKGPPPAPKPEISAAVFEFVNGTGDRYLFPKFSILETIPGPNGSQLLASFLIVRKGSTSDYGGDPNLDYYQPITIRLQSTSAKLLDQLSRVVAPREEVKLYMDDIMDNMTRAEYVLLAMRLPRGEKDEKENSAEKDAPNGAGVLGKGSDLQAVKAQPQEGVLWTVKATASSGANTAGSGQKATGKVLGEDEQYQKFISSVTPMEVDDA